MEKLPWDQTKLPKKTEEGWTTPKSNGEGDATFKMPGDTPQSQYEKDTSSKAPKGKPDTWDRHYEVEKNG